MAQIDQTHDPKLESWVPSANGHQDFPIQNLPLGVFSPRAGGKRGGVAIGDQILDLAAALAAGLFAGEAARRCRGRFRFGAQCLSGTRCRTAAGSAAEAVRIAGKGQSRSGQGGDVPACCGRLHAAPASAYRRLHRFLCRHSSCHQCRQAVPSRQSAAAELQARSYRLSWPRFVDPCHRDAGAASEGPDEAARCREPGLRPEPSARLRAGARRLDRVRQRSGGADPHR